MHVYACTYICSCEWRSMCFTMHLRSSEYNLQCQSSACSMSKWGLLLLYWNTMIKETREGNDLFSLSFYIIVHQLWKSRQELMQSKGPGGKSSFKHHRGVLITGLLSMICSNFFFSLSQDHQYKNETYILGWALPYQSLIKKIPSSFAYSLILFRHFLNWWC